MLQSKEALDKINANCKCIFGAQTVLMIANDRDREWKNPLEPGVSAGVEDVSIVATHMMLEAWELGIGSCWVNFFSPSAVKKAFDLPKNEEVVLLLPIGYTDKLSRPSAMHKKRVCTLPTSISGLAMADSVTIRPGKAKPYGFTMSIPRASRRLEPSSSGNPPQHLRTRLVARPLSEPMFGTSTSSLPSQVAIVW